MFLLLFVTEPLGTVLCHGALTSLHRVLPTASVGYSVFDLVDGLSLGPAFMAHGLVMFMFSTYVMEVNKNEVLAVMLALEVRPCVSEIRRHGSKSLPLGLTHISFLLLIGNCLIEFNNKNDISNQSTHCRPK